MLRSISLTRKSYSFSNTFSKCYRLRIEIRANHSEARQPPHHPEISEGLFLRDSYNSLWSSATPLTEIMSLDDFEPSSSVHFANTNDLPLHQYLDSILRPVPTIVETFELGGTVELSENERESLETAIAEGYDVSAVLDDLYASSVEEKEPVLIIRPPKRKPETGALEIKRTAATSSANIVEQPMRIPPMIIPQLPSTSYEISNIEEKPTDIILEPHEVILNAVEQQDMNALRIFLAANPWPRADTLGYRATEVLNFVIDRSSSSVEAFQMLENFMKVNSKSYINDDLLLFLGIRALRDNGVKAMIELLKRTKALSLVRKRSPSQIKERYDDLFRFAFNKENLDGAIVVFKGLSQLNMLNIPFTLRSLIQASLHENSLDRSISNWRRISRIAGTTEGVDILWDKVLQDSNGHQCIGKILQHCYSMETSNATLTEFICALAKNGLIDEAQLVFTKIFMGGKYFHKPLKRLVASNDLKSIELIAQLVTNCMFGEKKLKRNYQKPMPSSVKISKLSEVLTKELDIFAGRPENQKPLKFIPQDKKLKWHRVNEEQLYEVAINVRKAWTKLAFTEESMKNLRSWCERNGVPELKMLRFNRAAAAALHLQMRFLQQQASRMAGTSAARSHSENQPSERIIHTAEQLHTKYKEQMQNNKLENIFDIIERIEMSGNIVSGKIWDRTTSFLINIHDSTISSLSDRQLSQVLSVYGEKCDAIPNTKKNAALQNVLKSLESKGVKLGALSRTAVFTAKLDNGEIPSVVEELQAWETNGLSPTTEMLHQFARAYALEGNVQGIIDIMTHMKSLNMAVDENVVGPLVYAFAVKGQPEQADAVAKKFSGVLSEIALRSAFADGLIKAGKTEDAIKVISKISFTAKSQHVENRHILRVACNLIENNVHDGFDRLSAYIVTAESGKTLSEKNNNIYVLSRAKSARSNGNLLAALEMYAILHPNFKNSFFEDKAKEGFAEYMKSGNHKKDQILRLLDKVNSVVNIPDLDIFLLESAIASSNFESVFAHLKDKIPAILSSKPELKKDLAMAVIPELSKSDTTDERRTAIIVDLANIVFCKTDGENEIEDLGKLIYVAAGRDVPYIISALKVITDERVGREMASSVIQTILDSKGDALKNEKLEKLINSGVIETVNLSKVIGHLKRILSKKEISDKKIEFVAKLIALGFKPLNSRHAESYGAKFLVDLFVDKTIPTSRLSVIVDLLEKEPRARIPGENISEAEKKLAELKLEDRIEFLEKLRATGQTFQRWLKSSVEELRSELANMEAKENIPAPVIAKIRSVITNKLIDAKHLDLPAIVQFLATYLPKEDSGKNKLKIPPKCQILWERGIMAALEQSDTEMAEQFWKMGKTFSATPQAALCYIAAQFALNNTEQADAACADFIKSAQAIKKGCLELAGKLVTSYNVNIMEETANYLKEKLSLNKDQYRRFISGIKRKQLQELIEKGDLEAAFQMAVEETSASGLAFGQDELFKASFVKLDTALTNKVFQMVSNAHDKNNAIVDLSYAMLEHGIKEHGENLLKTNELKITSKKLQYLVNRALRVGRPDILESMLFSFNSNNAAPISDLNTIMFALTKYYYTKNDAGKLEELEAKLIEASYPIDPRIMGVFKGKEMNLNEEKTSSYKKYPKNSAKLEKA